MALRPKGLVSLLETGSNAGSLSGSLAGHAALVSREQSNHLFATWNQTENSLPAPSLSKTHSRLSWAVPKIKQEVALKTRSSFYSFEGQQRGVEASRTAVLNGSTPAHSTDVYRCSQGWEASSVEWQTKKKKKFKVMVLL